MDLSRVALTAIGVVRTNAEKIPRHWTISDVVGQVVLEERYERGLKDIQPGKRIVVIFLFHQSRDFTLDHLQQKPPHLDQVRGIFSTCSPVRPNPIGMSVVTVEKVEGPALTVRGIDMLDGTPVLDIKPYIAVP